MIPSRKRFPGAFWVIGVYQNFTSMINGIPRKVNPVYYPLPLSAMTPMPLRPYGVEA